MTSKIVPRALGLFLLLGPTSWAATEQTVTHAPSVSANATSHDTSNHAAPPVDEDALSKVDHSNYSSRTPIVREQTLKLIDSLKITDVTKSLLKRMNPSVLDFYLSSENARSTLDKALSNKKLFAGHGNTLMSLVREDAFGPEALKILQSLDILGDKGGLGYLLKPFIFHPVHSKRFLGGAAELHVVAQLQREGKLVGMPSYVHKAFLPIGYGEPSGPDSVIQVDGFTLDENGYQFVEVKTVNENFHKDPGRREGLNQGFPQTARNAKILGMPGLIIVSFIKRDGIEEFVDRLRQHVKDKVGSEAPMRVAYFNHQQRSHVLERTDVIEPLYEPEKVTIPPVKGPFSDHPIVRAVLQRKQAVKSSKSMSPRAKQFWEEGQQGLYSTSPRKMKRRR